MLTVLQSQDKFLRTTCIPVPITQIHNTRHRTLIGDMREILETAPAVGLAAPQIGVSEQLIVIQDKKEWMRGISRRAKNSRSRKPFPFTALFNPVIIARSPKTATFFEGCLSIPDTLGAVSRSLRIRVLYLDEEANEKTTWFEGWQARIIQHEIDHLIGILFTDIAYPGSIMDVKRFLAHNWRERTSAEIEFAFNKRKAIA
jgi:peptide deformylase